MACPRYTYHVRALIGHASATARRARGGAVHAQGLLLGIATFRAEVLLRLAGALLAAGAVVTVAGAVIPNPLNRILAVPVGPALIWLWDAVWSERETGIGTERSSDRETASEQ